MSEEYKIPEGLYYTDEHEWARLETDGSVVIGVTEDRVRRASRGGGRR
jgi:glycine cleavage system H lipoate-binding protein